MKPTSIRAKSITSDHGNRFRAHSAFSEHSYDLHSHRDANQKKHLDFEKGGIDKRAFSVDRAELVVRKGPMGAGDIVEEEEKSKDSK